LHAKSLPAIVSVVHLPDISAYMSLSGSSCSVSVATGITGRAASGGPASAGVAEIKLATAV
jgi:hypothetical protein